MPQVETSRVVSSFRLFRTLARRLTSWLISGCTDRLVGRQEAPLRHNFSIEMDGRCMRAKWATIARCWTVKKWPKHFSFFLRSIREDYSQRCHISPCCHALSLGFRRSRRVVNLSRMKSEWQTTENGKMSSLSPPLVSLSDAPWRRPRLKRPHNGPKVGVPGKSAVIKKERACRVGPSSVCVWLAKLLYSNRIIIAG